jgi:hypothetical protein
MSKGSVSSTSDREYLKHGTAVEHKALSSISSTAKKKKNQTERGGAACNSTY